MMKINVRTRSPSKKVNDDLLPFVNNRKEFSRGNFFILFMYTHWKKWLVASCLFVLVLFILDVHNRRTSNTALPLIYEELKKFGPKKLWSVAVSKDWMEVICKKIVDPTSEASSNKSAIPLKNLASFEPQRLSLEKGSPVFMIETTCRHDIRPRNLCTMESYAYHNPQSSIIGLFLMSTLYDSSGVLSEVLDAYSNIHLLNYNLTQLVHETPVETVIKDGSWTAKPEWIPQSLSDLFRLATIWKYGGLYTDNDILCLKQLEFLQNDDKNILASEHYNSLANGFFKMSAKHPFLFMVMTYLSENYNPNYWGFSGPAAFTTVTKKFCHKNQIYELWLESTKCGKIELLTGEKLFAIHWSLAYTIFQYPTKYSNIDFLQDSIGLHLANSKTHSISSYIGRESLFSILAANHCPVTLRALKKAKIKKF